MQIYSFELTLDCCPVFMHTQQIMTTNYHNPNDLLLNTTVYLNILSHFLQNHK